MSRENDKVDTTNPKETKLIGLTRPLASSRLVTSLRHAIQSHQTVKPKFVVMNGSILPKDIPPPAANSLLEHSFAMIRLAITIVDKSLGRTHPDKIPKNLDSEAVVQEKNQTDDISSIDCEIESKDEVEEEEEEEEVEEVENDGKSKIKFQLPDAPVARFTSKNFLRFRRMSRNKNVAHNDQPPSVCPEDQPMLMQDISTLWIMSCQLRLFDFSDLKTDQEKLCFWLNIVQCMYLHIILTHGSWEAIERYPDENLFSSNQDQSPIHIRHSDLATLPKSDEKDKRFTNDSVSTNDAFNEPNYKKLQEPKSNRVHETQPTENFKDDDEAKSKHDKESAQEKRKHSHERDTEKDRRIQDSPVELELSELRSRVPLPPLSASRKPELSTKPKPLRLRAPFSETPMFTHLYILGKDRRCVCVSAGDIIEGILRGNRSSNRPPFDSVDRPFQSSDLRSFTVISPSCLADKVATFIAASPRFVFSPREQSSISFTTFTPEHLDVLLFETGREICRGIKVDYSFTQARKQSIGLWLGHTKKAKQKESNAALPPPPLNRHRNSESNVFESELSSETYSFLGRVRATTGPTNRHVPAKSACDPKLRMQLSYLFKEIFLEIPPTPNHDNDPYLSLLYWIVRHLEASSQEHEALMNVIEYLSKDTESDEPKENAACFVDLDFVKFQMGCELPDFMTAVLTCTWAIDCEKLLALLFPRENCAENVEKQPEISLVGSDDSSLNEKRGSQLFKSNFLLICALSQTVKGKQVAQLADSLLVLFLRNVPEQLLPFLENGTRQELQSTKSAEVRKKFFNLCMCGSSLKVSSIYSCAIDCISSLH